MVATLKEILETESGLLDAFRDNFLVEIVGRNEHKKISLGTPLYQLHFRIYHNWQNVSV